MTDGQILWEQSWAHQRLQQPLWQRNLEGVGMAA